MFSLVLPSLSNQGVPGTKIVEELDSEASGLIFNLPPFFSYCSKLALLWAHSAIHAKKVTGC